MRRVYLAVVVVLSVLLAVFAAQNLDWVTMRFFGQSWHMPLAMLAVVLYVLGALTGGGLYGLIRHSYRRARTHARTDV